MSVSSKDFSVSYATVSSRLSQFCQTASRRDLEAEPSVGLRTLDSLLSLFPNPPSKRTKPAWHEAHVLTQTTTGNPRICVKLCSLGKFSSKTLLRCAGCLLKTMGILPLTQPLVLSMCLQILISPTSALRSECSRGLGEARLDQ